MKGRPAHRPPNPHAAEAVALVQAEEISPEEAAERLTVAGRRISANTIRRAMANGAAPSRPEAARADQPARGLSSASSTIPSSRGPGLPAPYGRETPVRIGPESPTGDDGRAPRHGPTGGDPPAAGLGPSPAPKDPLTLRARLLEELCNVAPTMPLHQQDRLLGTLQLERLRREAIARGLAPYHEAAAAVARELRAVRL